MARYSKKNSRNDRKSKAPVYIAYHVADRGEDKKGFWTRVGAAWDHEDGKGLTLQIDLVPVNGGRIVLREPSEQSED